MTMSEETKQRAIDAWLNRERRDGTTYEEIVDALTAHMRDELGPMVLVCDRCDAELMKPEQPAPAKCEECEDDCEGARDRKWHTSGTGPCSECACMFYKPAQPSPTTFAADHPSHKRWSEPRSGEPRGGGCGECGAGFGESCRDTSKSSPTTEAPETHPEEIELCTDHHGTRTWCIAGRDVVPPVTRRLYIRSDVVEKRVAEAVDARVKDVANLRLEKYAEGEWSAVSTVLGQRNGEGIIATARRVVAERDGAKRYNVELLDLVEQTGRVLNGESVDCDVDQTPSLIVWADKAIRAGKTACDERDAALAKVRELQAQLEVEIAAISDRDKLLETAEHELGEARADRDRYKAAQAECWNALESISVLVDPLVKP